MYPFPSRNDRRILPAEIDAWIRKCYGLEPVTGFGEFVSAQGVREASSRVASFLEWNRGRAWVLPLGSNGRVVWRTKPVPTSLAMPHVLFVFGMGLGNGSPMWQPSGQFDLRLDGETVAAFRVAKHSQTWRGEDSVFHFSAHRIESAPPNGSMTLDEVLTDEGFAAFGLGLLRVPRERLTPGQPATLEVVACSDVPSTRWFQLHNAPNVIHKADLPYALRGLAGERPEVAGHKVFFGDIHTHSGVSTHEPKGCGMGTREQNYAYARGPGGLDIYALTDHEWQVGPGGSAGYLGLADRYEEAGRFVCLPAFEHTSTLYGHRNVYYAEAGGEVVPAHTGWTIDYWNPDVAVTPRQLWDRLDQMGIPAITVPHHPSATSHPLSWDYHEPRYDRLMEVYSVWGSSEYYGDFPRGVSDRFRGLAVRDALARGYRMGLIASADGHDGHPGNAQSPHVKHHHQYHHLGSGWVAVLADELTRPAVFQALHDRRCYATTGVPIVLHFDVDGHPMGSECPAPRPGHRPVAHVKCAGSNGLDHVRLIKNGRVVLTAACHGEWACDIEWADPALDPQSPDVYYARVVQVDGESAWSSPVWIGPPAGP